VLDEGSRRGIVDLPLEPAAALARIQLLDGRPADALAVTDEPMQTVLRKDVWLWATQLAPVRVEALIATGATQEARQLVAAFAKGIAGRHMPAPAAALATCRARLIAADGDDTEAVAAWDVAAEAWADLPRPFDALLAREQQAILMYAGPNAVGGLDLLAEVYRGFSDLGATADADRVRATLTAYGAPNRTPWRGGRRGYGDSLSPRELEVVRLVLAGLTTPDIARALSRSPKTVAAQLNSAMRKHGVSSRTALAVAATQAGILPSRQPERRSSEHDR
jgi:DNA-binding CsgD family transcriptional regulator